MKITNHTVEELKDPTGILEGDRYEFELKVEVPEDDELFTEEGMYVKVIFVVDENGPRMAQYQLIEENTNRILDFALEEEEEVMILDYCQQNL
ncbi:hypothetical protein JOC86_000543 [Bacillus pakistanensis]|uniref:Pullulanase n=1 Tax=Rossellomorea pakistanensis TaxID=992288 RepID=A0ABS2N8W2_9BACI|nr:DUF6509 family protein [Bacillus pakistanensis]MBM7584006.1 hypothetical protein [Bacillus pakistanensis]